MAQVGQWGGLQLRIDVPPEVQSFIDGVNSIFTVLITALDVALTVLNVVKAFVSGLLNVVKQLIRELVNFIKNLILDFRQVGFYGHFGDAELATQDTTRDALRGGYAGYQNRMITRLLDRGDLTRPSFSSSSSVVALFFYIGVDLSFVDQLRDASQFNVFLDLVNGLAQLVGLNPPFTSQSSLPIPTNVAPAYALATSSSPTGSSSGVGIIRATTLAGRTNMVVQWNISPSPSNQPSTGPVIPPDGFLVEVSCFPQGLYAGWLAPITAGTGSPTGGDEARQNYTAGFYTDARNGEPLLIFGGVDSIQIGENIEYDAAFDGESLRSGATPLFFADSLTTSKLLNSNVIQRRGDGKYINQRTFYVDSATVRAQTWGTAGTYFTSISFDDLPLLAVPNDNGNINAGAAVVPDQVWVRVISCDDKIKSPAAWRWAPAPHLTPGDSAVSPVTPGPDGAITLASRGTASDIIPVTISRPQTDRYMDALMAAITLTMLSRSDLLPPSSSVTGVPVPTAITESGYVPTGLETVAANLVPITMPDTRRFFQQAGNAPIPFSVDLRSRVVALAQFLVEQQGNPPTTLITTLGPTIDRLLTWKWSDAPEVREGRTPEALLVFDYTMLDVLAQGQDAESGEAEIPCLVTMNTRCLSSLTGTLLTDTQAASVAAVGNIARKYRDGSFGRSTILDVSAAAPVLQNGEGALWYVRDIVPDSIYDDARTLLQIAGVPQQQPRTGTWLAWRPFVNLDSPLGSLNAVADEIERWASVVLEGLSGVADQIVAFINAIEQRILEIQDLIRRIQRYLNIPLSITIPDALFLPLVVGGTEGVATGLATSTNQPDDGPNVYSGGAVVLMGGLPALVQELIAALIASAG